MATIKGWFTMNGMHIPIMEGQSRAEAAKKYYASKYGKTVAKLSSNATNKLNEKEKKAINDWVHKDKNIDNESSQLLSNTIKNKGDVSGKVELFRNVTSPELGIRFSEIRNNPNILIGKEVEARSFLSTSKTVEGAQIFQGVTIKITKVSNTKGLDISKVSDKKRETEVVFNKGTKYKITKCKLIRDKTGDVMNYDIEAQIIK